VDAGARHVEIQDNAAELGTAGLGIPGFGLAAARVERREAVSLLPADARENSSRVDGAPVDSQRVDETVALRVPGGGQPGRGVDGRDAVSYLPAHRAERPAQVDGPPDRQDVFD